MAKRKKSTRNRRGQQRVPQKRDPRELSDWFKLVFEIVRMLWWFWTH